MTNESNIEQLLLGFHNAPGQDELKKMSYVRLCSELENSEAGSTRYMLIEAEKRVRDAKLLSDQSNLEQHHTHNSIHLRQDEYQLDGEGNR